MGGFITLDRKILNWEWYSDTNITRLFIHMLLKANWKDGRFKGSECPRGSFISSYQRLSEETGLSVKQVRTAIGHLKETNEVAIKSTNKFTVFTIKNYCQYQDMGTQEGNQKANGGHSKGNNRTSKKQYKQGNNIHKFPQREYDYDALQEKLIKE